MYWNRLLIDNKQHKKYIFQDMHKDSSNNAKVVPIKHQAALIGTPETYSESCQTFNMEHFAKIFNSF